MSRMRRRRCGTLFLVVAALHATASCSHVEPYYGARTGLAAPLEADDDVLARLLLIGDAGEPDPAGEPALEALAEQVNLLPKRTTVVFLGDNIYERGMPEPAPTPDPATKAAVAAAGVLVSDIFQTRQEAERILRAQAAVVRGNGARAIFIPGNHDWDQSNSGGWKRILAEEAYLRRLQTDEGLDVTMQPGGGCPGPVRIPLQGAADLIVLDTEWWLNPSDEEKPTPANNPTGCPYVTADAIQKALLAELEESAKGHRRSVVAAHHPLMSRGAHGGFVDGWTHIFPLRVARYYVPFYVEWLPLPILGSAMVGYRACCSPSAQDMPNDQNRSMRAALTTTLRDAADHDAAPLAYVAGHDHGLQVFSSDLGPPFVLVSGLGSTGRASEVGSNSHTLFAHSNSAHPGFMQIDFLRDGHARIAVIEYEGKQEPPEEMYSLLYPVSGPVKADLESPQVGSGQ